MTAPSASAWARTASEPIWRANLDLVMVGMLDVF
jgi:hypothetical protein